MSAAMMAMVIGRACGRGGRVHPTTTAGAMMTSAIVVRIVVGWIVSTVAIDGNSRNVAVHAEDSGESLRHHQEHCGCKESGSPTLFDSVGQLHAPTMTAGRPNDQRAMVTRLLPRRARDPRPARIQVTRLLLLPNRAALSEARGFTGRPKSSRHA